MNGVRIVEYSDGNMFANFGRGYKPLLEYMLFEGTEKETLLKKLEKGPSLTAVKSALAYQTAGLFYDSIAASVAYRLGDETAGPRTGISRGIIKHILNGMKKTSFYNPFKMWFANTNEKTPWRGRMAAPIKSARTWDELKEVFAGDTFFDEITTEFLAAAIKNMYGKQADAS